MRLYLDDDSVDPLLVRLLRKAQHDAVTPADVGRVGSHDADHFATAILANRVVLTRNHKDFVPLNALIGVAGGHHPGIFLIRQDNNPSRDMPPARIVRAIRNFLAAGIPVVDNVHILNHWR